MIRKFLKIIACVFLSVGFLNCGHSELHLYNWEDYIDPALIEKFEKEFKCKVTVDIFTTLDDLYSEMKNVSRIKKYDILLPSPSLARKMYMERMLRIIDHSQLPNISNISMSTVKRTLDPGLRYSIPYLISYTGIAYNKSMVKDFKPSWSMFGRDDLVGKVGLLDDMREVIGAALKLNMNSYNATDESPLDRAGLVLAGWKKNVGKISDVHDLEVALKDRSLYLIQSYNGDAYKLMQENSNIGFAIPTEGTAINMDSFVIPLEALNVKLAYKFINFFLDAEVSKNNMRHLFFLAPNTAAQKLLEDSFVKNPAINPPQSILLRSNNIEELHDTSKHDELWRMMKR